MKEIEATGATVEENSKNIMGALVDEIVRCEKVLENYKMIPSGYKLTSVIIENSIKKARKTIMQNNTVGMIGSLKDLQKIME